MTWWACLSLPSGPEFDGFLNLFGRSTAIQTKLEAGLKTAASRRRGEAGSDVRLSLLSLSSHLTVAGTQEMLRLCFGKVCGWDRFYFSDCRFNVVGVAHPLTGPPIVGDVYACMCIVPQLDAVRLFSTYLHFGECESATPASTGSPPVWINVSPPQPLHASDPIPLLSAGTGLSLLLAVLVLSFSGLHPYHDILEAADAFSPIIWQAIDTLLVEADSAHQLLMDKKSKSALKSSGFKAKEQLKALHLALVRQIFFSPLGASLWLCPVVKALALY